MDLKRREELRAEGRRWAAETAVAQGFPEKIEDVEVLAQVATLLLAGRDEPRRAHTRQTGVTRRESNRLRPRTAGPMTA